MWRERADRIAADLSDVAGLETAVTTGDGVSVAPEVVVRVDSDAARSSATNLVRALRAETPRIFVGSDRLGGYCDDLPLCLEAGEIDYVLERIRAHAACDC